MQDLITFCSNQLLVRIEFTSLISSSESLKSVYKRIQDIDLLSNYSLCLQKVYETLYSPEDISEEKIDETITELKSIVTEYVRSGEVVDTNITQGISSCITYLGEFKKYQQSPPQQSRRYWRSLCR